MDSRNSERCYESWASSTRRDWTDRSAWVTRDELRGRLGLDHSGKSRRHYNYMERYMQQEDKHSMISRKWWRQFSSNVLSEKKRCSEKLLPQGYLGGYVLSHRPSSATSSDHTTVHQ